MNRQSTRRLLLASSAIASFAVVGIAGVADAQTSTARAGEVVVTGSRIARKDYVADSPIVTVTPKQIENTGLATVEALTNQLPQVVPAATSTSNNPSNSGRANIQLRGIGSQRTLVLLDGRRPTPSDNLGRVDLNTIPAALIENIEVITGGASAAYGSDAVAGVVNFHLKHRFTGVQLDAQYGKTDRNDGAEQQYSITAGGNFADDRGNAVMSFTYGSRDRIYNANRAFSSYSGASSTLPFGNITTAFTRAQTDAIFARYGIAPGTAATNKFAFNSDGTLIGFDPVSGAALNYKGPTTIDYSTLLKGQGSVATGAYNTGPLNDLVIPLERYTAFGRAEYEINRHAKFYGQFMYTDYTTSTELAPAPGSNAPLLAVVTINGNTINSVGGTGFYVPVSNPFIPADLRTLLANRAPVNGVSVANSPFVLNKRTSTFGPRHSEERYNTSNFTTGVTAKSGSRTGPTTSLLPTGG